MRSSFSRKVLWSPRRAIRRPATIVLPLGGGGEWKTQGKRTGRKRAHSTARDAPASAVQSNADLPLNVVGARADRLRLPHARQGRHVVQFVDRFPAQRIGS